MISRAGTNARPPRWALRNGCMTLITRRDAIYRVLNFFTKHPQPYPSDLSRLYTTQAQPALQVNIKHYICVKLSAMKKIVITLSLICAVVISPAFAQFEIKPFMGANFSNVSKAPDGVSTQARLGVQVGASAIFGNRLHLMPGIAWFSRSTEYSVSGATNFDQTINGVIIPLLLGFRFVDGSTQPFINVRAFAGPALMFLTKTEFSGGQSSEAVDWSNSQWGAQVGLGLDIAIFFVDLGYEAGLTNTASANNVEGFTDFKSNTFFVNAGLRLTFAR